MLSLAHLTEIIVYSQKIYGPLESEFLERDLELFPIKAGPEFFKLFADNPHLLKGIRMNVPHTIGLFDNRFFLKTNEKGELECTYYFKEEEVIWLFNS